MRISIAVAGLITAWAEAGFAQPATPRARIHDCDRLVAPPTMLVGVPGVPFPRIDTAAGRTACAAAVREHPDEPRFTGLLARVELAANRDQEAARLAQDAATRGDAQAQTLLGVMHEQGRGGLARDARAAARLYRQAADQGFSVAQSNLGFMYESGRGGLRRSGHEAVRLYRLAADQGLAAGQSNLGSMYYRGRGGLRRDRSEAARLYRLAPTRALRPRSPGLPGCIAWARAGSRATRRRRCGSIGSRSNRTTPMLRITSV